MMTVTPRTKISEKQIYILPSNFLDLFTAPQNLLKLKM